MRSLENVARWLLRPLSSLYALGACIWHHAWDRGWFPVVQLPVPVISVGSLFAGGSGKTPVVMALARALEAQGLRVLVLSRGYRRRTRRPRWVGWGETLAAGPDEAGDEPVMLARWTPVAVAVGRRREHAFALARTHSSFDVVVLDDGFQYRRLARTVNLVLIDVPNWHRRQTLLPTGLLREPLHHLDRADAVLVTKATEVEEVQQVERMIRPYLHRNQPVFGVYLSIDVLLAMHEGGRPCFPKDLPPGSWFVTATVAEPNGFLRDLAALNIHVGAAWFRSDHARWRPRDLRRLVHRSRGYRGVITTLKDWVKMEPHPLPLPIWVARQQVTWDPAFWTWLQSRLP